MSARANVATVVSGRPAAELSDAELEAQGTQAHATRNWVFLHGTAEQFARHTSRMLELEQEYLHRHPHRTWQGSGGAVTDRRDEAAALRSALRGIIAQLESLAGAPAAAEHSPATGADPTRQVLISVAEADGGRLHKLEVHQAAREAGLDRAGLAALYTGTPPLLVTDRQDRLITEAGVARLRQGGWRAPADRAAPVTLSWRREEHPSWDVDKQRIIGRAGPGVFDLDYTPGAPVPGDWWSAVAEDGRVVGYGWMDVTWGEAEILLAVDPAARTAGVGSFVLGRLEREAGERGLNYVYNTVATGHPDRDAVSDWLGVRGYRDDHLDGILRKRLRPAEAPVPAGPAAAPSTPPAGDLGPGREDRGGYVDVEDHQY